MRKRLLNGEENFFKKMKFVKITVIKVYIIVLVFNLIHVYLLFEQLQLDLIKLL